MALMHIMDRNRGEIMESVCVLMSTYNGEKYLRTQLDSILAQIGNFNLLIHIRDDGSTDNTQSILQKYAQIYTNITWEQGNTNLGSTLSFMKLMYEAPKANYYALADQDDYWMPEKIQKAIVHLKYNKVMLYCSAKKIVDSELHPLNRKDPEPEFKFSDTMFKKNMAFGCTFVYTQAMASIIKKYPFSWRKGFHDSWLFKLAVLFGNIYYDHEAYILYRQHSTNVVGANDISFMRRLHYFFMGDNKKVIHAPTHYAQALLSVCSADLQKKEKQLLEDMVFGHNDWKRRIRLFFEADISCSRLWEYLWIKYKIIMGRF